MKIQMELKVSVKDLIQLAVLLVWLLAH